MIPYVASAGLALAGVALVRPMAWLAALGDRAIASASDTPSGLERPTVRTVLGADALRLAAVLAALPLLIGGSNGDVVVGAVLAGAAVGRRMPAAALVFISVAAVAAARVGSTAVDDIVGAQRVLGPAFLSPDAAVATAALCSGLACLLAAAVLLPRSSGSGSGSVAAPSTVANAVLPVLALVIGVVVAAGPPIATDVDVSWVAPRVGAVVGGWALAAVIQGLGSRARHWRPELAAAALAVAGVLSALVAR